MRQFQRFLTGAAALAVLAAAGCEGMRHGCCNKNPPPAPAPCCPEPAAPFMPAAPAPIAAPPPAGTSMFVQPPCCGTP